MVEKLPIPHKYQTQRPLLSPDELARASKSAEVKSLKEAEHIAENLGFPMLVIPQGENDSGSNFHVVSNKDELASAVAKSLEDAVKGAVHLVSRPDIKLPPGEYSSEANYK